MPFLGLALMLEIHKPGKKRASLSKICTFYFSAEREENAAHRSGVCLNSRHAVVFVFCFLKWQETKRAFRRTGRKSLIHVNKR